MEKKEQDDLKRVITERFVEALDYLMDSGRLNSIVEFERLTGFRAQRIAGMRTYVSNPENSKNQFVGVHHLKVLRDLFNVSMEYIFDGIHPIVRTADLVTTTENGLTLEQFNLLKKEVQLLSQKFNFLEDRMNTT